MIYRITVTLMQKLMKYKIMIVEKAEIMLSG
jgi:hypothetical protein